MKQEIELIEYLPEFLREIREYQELFEAENPEFVLLYRMTDALLDNGFIMTADLQGLKRWEQLLGILASGQDLAGRRAAVLGKWNRSLPYTMVRLYEYLDVLAEREEYHILLSPADYRLELVAEDLPFGVLRAMYDLVREMIPANMLFILSDRILNETAVWMNVQAGLRMTGIFYPRSNVPPHYLDGTTRLDGKYFLNGFLTGRTIDFYPLALRVCGEADGREGMSAGGQTAFCGGAAKAAETKAAMRLQSAGDAAPVPAGRMQVSMCAGRAGGVTVAGSLRIEKNWKTLDGSKPLDGSRMLDAEAYEAEL